MRTIFICSTILFWFYGINDLKGQDNTPATYGETLTFDLSTHGKIVKNLYSDVNVWDFRSYWGDKASDQPTDYFSINYASIKTIQFMTATGGNKNRDLFLDPDDRSVLDDYNFDRIISALHNVVRQGLKPMIKTGAVPLKFSANPVIGKFGVNVRQPEDYDVYYDYIKAMVISVQNK